MAKTWILDTETKGTGARMVPLEDVQRPPAPAPEPAYVDRRPAERPQEPTAPPPPRRFKVTDVMTGRVLAEDADARATVALLAGVRSVVDVRVSLWDHESAAWRVLTLAEQRALWDLRHRGAREAA